MDRNREPRRASVAAANGLSRRRHRSSSLRDSPEEDGAMELQEPAKLRYRGVKKDRDRDRDRLSRSKRRRGDRLMHGSAREDGGEDSTEESVNDEEEEEDDDDGGGSGPVRMLPPNPAASISNHHHQQGKSFPPAAKIFRAVPAWKPADEMIGVSVPRKARSASTKRSHECWLSGSGVGGDQIHRQASASPVRPSLASTSTPSPAPISPPSSNVSSARKKMKTNGAKPRPPKSSLKSSSSSNPEELEIEIAEVLYGLMTQSQGPSKKEIMSNDSGKLLETNKSNSDSKSRVSSPISNSQSTVPQSSVILPLNSTSSAPTLSAIAPKRKRPRQLSDSPGSFSARNGPLSSTAKVEMDQLPKTEISSPNFEKTSASAVENGGLPYDLANTMAAQPSSESPPELAKPESSAISESKPLTDEAGEIQDVTGTKEEFTSSKKESPVVRVDDDREDVTATKANSNIHENEDQREEKFQIDLMAPPPQLRSSPEREGKISFVERAADHKQMVSNGDAEIGHKAKDKEDDKAVKIFKDSVVIMEPDEKSVKTIVEEPESQKIVVDKDRNIDLQLDLEKLDRHEDSVSASGNKAQPHVPKLQQQQLKAKKEELQAEKAAQSPSLPLPMSVACWPGGLPPMGYISMDGSTVSSTPIQPLFNHPRPKKCATHCYIARNIHNLQQIMKMNAFWPAPASSAAIFGAKPSDLNAMPPAELHKNISGRRANSGQEKGQGLAIFPSHSAKERGGQAANIADTTQRKQQILLQQALPPGVPTSNVLHGPAFIFPMSQQQTVAAAASVRPGSVKSPSTTGSLASSNAASSASASASAPAAATASTMSFNYPNVAANEAQYLAILQNNGYPFPIPAVGAPPNYRPAHAQAMPYFNGSFYSSQIMHPPQFQHQQQQQPPSQQPQMQQGHQNTSILSAASTSQKHLQSQHQRQQGSSTNSESGTGNLTSFPAPKNRSSQPAQQPQPLNQHILQSQPTRQLESDVGGEECPSTTDSRVSRASMNVYGQNFVMPIHPQNFALMSPPVLGGTGGASGGDQQSEKKQLQQSQQQGSKAGVETLPPQTFALSFAPINGVTTPHGIDISSMTQNQAIFQSLPEATRQSYQILAAAAAAQAAQQKKNFRASEEVKTGGSDSSNLDEEKKGLVGKVPATVGHSIAFSRPDPTDTSGSSISGSTVIDSSARTLNLASAPARTSRSAVPSVMGTINASNSQIQAQLQLQHQQQIIQLQKHKQQLAAAATRSKTPATSNGSVYSDQLTSSSSLSAKFSNVISPFPQNIVQSSNSSSPAHSPQWKNSTRPTTSQVPSLMASSTPSSLKNLPQHQARGQQSHHTQISFGACPKSSTSTQGQQAPHSNNQSSSPPMVVGSPTTSSFSRGASGSPRTASSSGNKAAQPPTLSSTQTKNSPSVQSRKSSPVGGRNVPSILGNPHITSSTSSSSTVSKPQMQQQQLPKQTLQQQQLCFSSTYMPAQAPHSASTSSTTSASNSYYIQRRRSDQPQQPQGTMATSSSGMLSLCPPVSTCDPAKAIAAAAVAAAAGNVKGGSLPAPGILHPAQFGAQSSGNPHQLIPAGYSYAHSVSAAVQVKPSEQKQPAGNDNLNACWQPEKK